MAERDIFETRKTPVGDPMKCRPMGRHGMTNSVDLAQLVGNWSGTKRLWLSPSEPPYGCPSTASVVLIAQGQFATLQYTWTFQDEPQDGVLLTGVRDEDDTAVWTDSWHMSRKLMICSREAAREGTLAVTGSYAAPPGPDWGWRIELEVVSPDRMVMRMYNLPPQGQEALAVEAVYDRR